MPDFEHMLYMTYPRGCAIAEVGWSPLAAKDFQDFYETRLPQQLEALRCDACQLPPSEGRRVSPEKVVVDYF